MSSDPSSSSTSKSPIVTKTLIDLAEYNRLLDLKHHLDHQEKKLSEQLQHSVHQHQQKGEGESSSTGETKEEEEASIASEPQKDDSKHQIVSEILTILEKRYGLVIPSANTQTGTGLLSLM
jgi:hypothetical protein